MVSSSIPDPPGFYRLCIVVPSGGCRVGFSLELVAWWARGSVCAGWAAAGYLSVNWCRVRSTRRFLCWTFKKKSKTIDVYLIEERMEKIVRRDIGVTCCMRVLSLLYSMDMDIDMDLSF
ncbi:hypothetical protein HanPI659440_Chr13g0496071 [Helianthus annuus]|nr:hypothetical protein HanPI659440_Chr13g0496071 [Helianthus annuus]